VAPRSFSGPDKRQDQRVYEILGELSTVASDLQTRSSTLVAMVEILQREVMRQDDEDATEEERQATLNAIEATAREVVATTSDEDSGSLKQTLEGEDS